jgi:gamma-D-glutamyl-L-lysine dipeptidyl-peptidase
MRILICIVLLASGRLLSEQLVCQRPVANLHCKPTIECEVESQLVYGCSVELLKRQRDGWAQVRMQDGYEGWVAPGTLLKPAPTGAQMGRTQNLFCHIYRVQDTSPYPPLLTLPLGVPLQVLSEPPEQNRRWVEVRLLDGTTGWIHRGDIDTAPQPLTLDEVLALAQRYVGLPYTWGGSSSFGFDCSGLVQSLYGLMGIQFPRNARDQAQVPGMVPCSLDELVRGDFIFFENKAKRIVHVGLYLGEGQFLHANASAGNPIVLISDLEDPKWKTLYPTWIPSKYTPMQK